MCLETALSNQYAEAQDQPIVQAAMPLTVQVNCASLFTYMVGRLIQLQVHFIQGLFRNQLIIALYHAYRTAVHGCQLSAAQLCDWARGDILHTPTQALPLPFRVETAWIADGQTIDFTFSDIGNSHPVARIDQYAQRLPGIDPGSRLHIGGDIQPLACERGSSCRRCCSALTDRALASSWASARLVAACSWSPRRCSKIRRASSRTP